jgi:cytochrome c-type biogenesis protein CcmH/NrfF
VALPGAAAAPHCPKTSLPDVQDDVMGLQCGVPQSQAEDAPTAKRQRAFIQRQIDQCRSKQQIKDQLVAQFGDRILTEPKQAGAWLVPVLGFALGALAVALIAWRWRGRRRAAAATPAAAGPPMTHDDADRLDRDIDRYDL